MYIEKEYPGEYFNPTSSTVKVIDKYDTNCKGISTTALSEEEERWKWLTEKWSTMTYKEKIALFTPLLHYLNLRNNLKTNFDEQMNSEIVDVSYTTCRTFNSFKYEIDRQSAPNMILVFNPINPELIPDSEVKASVIVWGQSHGFL